MTNLKNHPTQWLRDDAAAAFDRAEDEHGVLSVTSAGRTEAEQQALIKRWDQGGASNRPPYLYPPARPAASSNHVRDGGIAIDTSDFRQFSTYSPLYGFIQSFPGSDPVHFDYVGLAPSGNLAPNQVTKDRQSWLISLGITVGATGADGIEGAATKAGYKAYQRDLRAHWGYTGEIDGIWGAGTQAAHQRKFDAMHAAPAPAPSYPVVTIGNIGSIGDVRGLQKIAKANGYKGAIDGIWGAGSQRGFKTFLDRNYGGSIVSWLTRRWGYRGDDRLGPVMTAALQRANAENFRAL